MSHIPEDNETHLSSLRAAADLYPPEIRDREMERISDGRYPLEMRFMDHPGGRVVDLGGGVAATSVALRSLGADVTVVDDYRRPYYEDPPFQEAIARIRDAGVSIVERDLLETDLEFLDEGSIDAIGSFDCLEHLHHSPKRLFEAAVRSLRPGGRLIIGVPNSVNALKRLRVAVGKTNLSSLDEFYDRGTPFTGHVREFTVRELHSVARDLGLVEVSVIGRNWFGHNKLKRVPRLARNAADRALRWRPQLCSNLYLEAHKPG